MIHRIMTRNGEAFKSRNCRNHRFFKEGMRGFLRLYDMIPKENGSVDTIDKETVEKILQFVKQELKPPPDLVKNKFITKEFSTAQFEQYQQELLEKFKNHKRLYVVPKKKYDHILKTNKMNPKECAQHILNFVTPKKDD